YWVLMEWICAVFARDLSNVDRNRALLPRKSAGEGGMFFQADIFRVIQGVITGVGFIGAGVILYRPTDKKVHGLTTAAAIWVTAAMGVLCGLGAWRIVGIAVPFVLALLIAGGPLEKWCHKQLGPEGDSTTPLDSDRET